MAKTDEKKTQGAELAPWDEGIAPAMIEPTPELVKQAWDALFEGKLPPEIGDSSITARAIMEKIRDADNFDQVFSPATLPSWQEYDGVPVTVFGFHLNPSTIEEGHPVYAVVEIGIMDTGDVRTVSTGGGNVLTQLIKAWEQSWFPFNAKMVVGTTADKKTVLRLEKV